MLAMKVLLVQSYLGQSGNFPVYPLGLAYISTALYHKGHTVQIFDPNIAALPYENLKESICRFSPEIIGISLRNIDNQHRIAPFYYYTYFQRILEIIKKTDDESTKKTYEKRLNALKGILFLERAVVAYQDRFKKPPEKLDELMTKDVIREIPQDPYGGEFYIDKDGSIKTTSNLR